MHWRSGGNPVQNPIVWPLPGKVVVVPARLTACGHGGPDNVICGVFALKGVARILGAAWFSRAEGRGVVAGSACLPFRVIFGALVLKLAVVDACGACEVLHAFVGFAGVQLPGLGPPASCQPVYASAT
jgi:hypothetical protein